MSARGLPSDSCRTAATLQAGDLTHSRCTAGTVSENKNSVEPAGLIQAIATSRDRTAFTTLFQQFAPRIKAYFVRLGLDNASADEATQEVLLTVWRKAAQFDPRRASAATWMFTIARNLRIDMARREHPYAAVDPSDVREPEPAPEQMLAFADLCGQVAAALATLPPEQADVIRLAFYDDRPHAEIERALGIPLGTVKSRLRLAAARLRRVLDPDY